MLVASVVLLALAATAGGSGKASARTLTFGARSTVTPEISSNWSGYAALSADPVAAVEFTDVTATWRQPKSTCTANRVSSAAFWVGLGGYDPASIALEQLGTGADCDGTAKAPTYYAWWELIPAASVRIPLKINPGDTISAAVFLRSGQTIVFSLKNLTRHTRFSKVLTTDQEVDTTSAEWIAEAPSDCSFAGRCLPVALTNFGSVTFSNIAAIGNAHPGTLTDPAWTSSAIELIADGSTDVFFGHGDVLGPGVGAVPGDPTSDGRAFSVGWQRNLTPP
jgi:peptidase A4-like protein